MTPPYNPVPTYLTGDSFTAANANTYWRDNFAAGVPDIFTSKGDLPVATSANVAAALAVGADDKLLRAASGEVVGMKWDISPVQDLITTKGDILLGTAADALARLGAPANGLGLVAASGEATGWIGGKPGAVAKYSRAANQAITSDASYHDIQMTSEDKDTNGFIDLLSDNTKIIIPAGMAGSYKILAGCQWTNTNAGNTMYLAIYHNAVAIGFIGVQRLESVVDGAIMAWAEDDFAVGDYIKIACHTASGYTMNVFDVKACMNLIYKVA